MLRTTMCSELRRFLKLVALLGCAVCLMGPAAPLLRAQADIVAARLDGVVSDPSGAPIPRAQLTLTDMHTGFKHTFTTTDVGEYNFTLLPPGTYRLTAEKTGFKIYSQSDIVLQVAQSSTLNVKLEVGSLSETVQVSASAPLLETSDANISSDLNTRAVEQIPLGWRNVYALIALNSSVNDTAEHQSGYAGGSTIGGDDQNVAFTQFGGARFGTTAYLLDGHWNADQYGGNLVMYAPIVDEVEEMNVQSNSFTSQYGWSMGNYVNAVTKSGTNSFHGDLFEFLRNSDLDANYFFNNAYNIPRSTYRLNQYGFTAGGPLWIPKLYQQRSKTFIFGAFEGRRLVNPFSTNTQMPTTNMEGGNFTAFLGPQIGTDALGRPVLSGQIYNPFTTRQITAGAVDPTTGLTATQSGYIRDPFKNNVIPSGLLNPVALAAQKFYPAPNITNAAPGANNFVASAGATASEDAYTVRVDQIISDKSRFFARWSQKHLNGSLNGSPSFFGAGNPAGNYVFEPDNRLDAAADYAHSFSPTTIMTLDLGFGRWVQGRTPPVFYKAASLGLPAFLDTAGASSVFPTFNITGMNSLGPVTGINATPEDNNSINWGLSKIHGKHSLSFGYTLLDIYWYNLAPYPLTANFTPGFTQGPDPTTANPNTGLAYASFLLGTGSGSITVQAEAADHKNMNGAYAQDDWRITPKLTVNLGLRYEYQTAPTDRYNRFAWFNYSGTNPISSQVGFNVPGYLQFTGGGNRRGIFIAQKTNFAPRLGLAYSVSNKMVVRAGFGMFYTPAAEIADYEGLDEFGTAQTTPWIGTLDGITPTNLLSNPMPGGLLVPQGKSLGPLTNVGQSTDAMEPVRPTPYVEQWMLGVQYGLAKHDSLEVAYIGNHGVKLLAAGIAKNQLTAAQLAQGNNLLTEVQNPFYGHITSSGCGLDQPTIPKGQLLLPYPEFCGVNDPQMPGESSWYDAMQVTYTHRFSQGLQMLASFTASKYLDTGSGNEGWAVGQSDNYQNNNNLSAEKSLDGNDIPKSLVVSYVYQLPVGKGQHFGSSWNRAIDGVLGGWQSSGVATFKDGFPLAIQNAVNNTGSYAGDQRPNLIGNPHVSNPSITEWFNVNAFAQPAPYTFGNLSRTMPNLRAPGYNNWDIAIEKYIPVHEQVRFQLRAEMFNAFSHTNFYAPNQTFGSGPTFGQITQAYAARYMQMVMKLYW